MLLPEGVDGLVMLEGCYELCKIASKDEGSKRNVPLNYSVRGALATNPIQINGVARVEGLSDFMQTSRIESIYQHETSSGFDKLVLLNWNIGTTDLCMPPHHELLQEGDLLLSTANSVYLLYRRE